MAGTGGTTSYSPISLLTGTALLPKTTAVAKPVTTAARPASTSAPVSLSNPVLKPVSTMSGSSGSAASSASRPSSTSVKPPAYSGLDQALAQRYVAPAQQAQRIADAWETGTLLPMQKNTITGERRLAMPGILQSAIDAFKLPGDVLAGRNQNFTPGYATPGGISDALNFVGNFAGAGSVVPRPANSLGVFGNQLAATFDRNALQAAANDARIAAQKGYGLLPDDLWTGYGLEMRPGYGGAVYEIPGASKAGFDMRYLPTPPKVGDRLADAVDLSKVLDWPELFRAGQNAPPMRVQDVPVAMLPATTKKSLAGGYNPKSKYIELNPNLAPDDMRETLMHELEHVMQDFYGRPGGTFPEVAGSWRAYLSAPGELDARLSEYRSTTPDNILRQLPLSSVRIMDRQLMEPKLTKVGEQPYAAGVPWIGSVPWAP